MYEDDLDNAEDVVYTGQGGHNLTGDKRQFRDQKLETPKVLMQLNWNSQMEFQLLLNQGN